MSFAALVRSRLVRLGFGQKDLARAAEVTESYISQLLARKKAPPARDRTDIYPKMEAFLELAPGELGRLAELERAEELARRLARPPEPMFQRFRDLILRKCAPGVREEVRAIFDAEPFGLLERLVAGKLLEAAQRVARQQLDNEEWIRRAAEAGRRSKEAMRVVVLEFLDADVLHVSNENCVQFLEPLVESWSVDLDDLRIDIALAGALVAHPRRSFAFVESEPDDRAGDDPALEEFLRDPQLNDHATEDEIRLLRRHRFGAKRPNKLYYYRALQNLRDPLHFLEAR